MGVMEREKSALIPSLERAKGAIKLKSALVPPRLHKEPIFGRAINMRSRGSTEQCFCVLEPYCGCL